VGRTLLSAAFDFDSEESAIFPSAIFRGTPASQIKFKSGGQKCRPHTCQELPTPKQNQIQKRRARAPAPHPPYYDVWSNSECSLLTAESPIAESSRLAPCMKNLGILLSGRGSNFEAIANNVASGKIPDARITAVISNRPDAGGIEVARRLGLTALVIPSKGKPREEHDREVVAALRQHQVELVCLAGYMRLLSPWFVQQFPRRILNIHPSLLPSFPGLEAQEQAFAYGVKVTGCTVHFVDEELDHGAIIVQKAIAVLDTDDEHTLAARILEQEHAAYSEAINLVIDGKHQVKGRRLVTQITAG
jgi:phosphoribosylglycinamide formyltransferase 1